MDIFVWGPFLAFYAAILISNRNFNEKNYALLRFNEKKIEELNEAVHDFIASCRNIELAKKTFFRKGLDKHVDSCDIGVPGFKSTRMMPYTNEIQSEAKFALEEIYEKRELLVLKQEAVMKNMPASIKIDGEAVIARGVKLVVDANYLAVKKGEESFVVKMLRILWWPPALVAEAMRVIDYTTISRELDRIIKKSDDQIKAERERIESSMGKCRAICGQIRKDTINENMVDIESLYNKIKDSYSNIEDAYVNVLREKIKRNRLQEILVSFISLALIVVVLYLIGGYFYNGD
ncbi:hypothetical protein MKP05_14760 [Halomonas sp. EGI 63088]|uniref:Uncharacterized protein n=1 Tax=Halomonas flagellata TaxID=2920385 RepID=A0ABS9RX13_9GAMM|nr:hypothetical protein [Halomonas flagellata]MCH4564369.1 hypothetical protein [Halomonas flagellata]